MIISNFNEKKFKKTYNIGYHTVCDYWVTYEIKKITDEQDIININDYMWKGKNNTTTQNKYANLNRS